MDVWSVGEDLMSDWLDLSGHQHPNCYLGPGQMTGLVPYLRVVVELDFVKEDLSHEIQTQMGHLSTSKTQILKSVWSTLFLLGEIT